MFRALALRQRETNCENIANLAGFMNISHKGNYA